MRCRCAVPGCSGVASLPARSAAPTNPVLNRVLDTPSVGVARTNPRSPLRKCGALRPPRSRTIAARESSRRRLTNAEATRSGRERMFDLVAFRHNLVGARLTLDGASDRFFHSLIVVLL